MSMYVHTIIHTVYMYVHAYIYVVDVSLFGLVDGKCPHCRRLID